MKTDPKTSLCSVLSLLLTCGGASAASVFINAPAMIGGPVTAVAGAKLRAAPSNWDMSLDAGGGTFAGNFIQADLAASFNPPGRTYNFTLEHRAGEGLVFQTVQGANPAVTLAWGNFSSPPPSKVVATINGQPPPANFNLLNLEAVSERASSTVTFSNLLFSSPTLSIGGGAFQSGTAHSGMPGGITQSFIADTSLGTHSWTLSGTITLLRPGAGGGSDDSVRFVVTAGNASFAGGVPEPGQALYVAAGAALLLRRKRSAA